MDTGKLPGVVFYRGREVQVGTGGFGQAPYIENYARNDEAGARCGFFARPNCYRHERHSDIGIIVLHWDACQSSSQCYDVLVQRGLSIHFTIGKDGQVEQRLDLDCMAYHVGNANPYTVGIEINNPFSGHDDGGRPVISEVVPNGGAYAQRHYGFTDAQVDSVVKMCHLLCGMFAIPKRIPSGTKPCLDPSNPLARKWKGVAGHYHFTSNKMDPGMQLWPALVASGFDVVVAP